MKFIIAALTTIALQQAFAAESKNTNLLAVGQGISSPTSTSTINYSSGYTNENSIGTIYQNGFRVGGQHDSNDDSKVKAYGAEAGYGQGQWGIAIGHRKPDCDGCKGTTAAGVGVNISGVGVGFRFAEDLSAAALLFNPHGDHRVGVMAELNTAAGSGSNVTAYGLGYSYVASQLTFSIDALAIGEFSLGRNRPHKDEQRGDYYFFHTFIFFEK